MGSTSQELIQQLLQARFHEGTHGPVTSRHLGQVLNLEMDSHKFLGMIPWQHQKLFVVMGSNW